MNLRTTKSPLTPATAGAIRLALTLLACLAALAPARAESLAKYTGTFYGCVLSGGDFIPIELNLEASGATLAGAYMMSEDDGSLTPGTVRLLNPPVSRSLHIEWRDKYGIGTARLSFDPTYNRFSGNWASGDNDVDENPSGGWDGARGRENKGSTPFCKPPIS